MQHRGNGGVVTYNYCRSPWRGPLDCGDCKSSRIRGWMGAYSQSQCLGRGGGGAVLKERLHVRRPRCDGAAALFLRDRDRGRRDNAGTSPSRGDAGGPDVADGPWAPVREVSRTIQVAAQ